MARKKGFVATREARWLFARKLTQGAALLVFLWLFAASAQRSAPPSLVNLPMRLSPLAMLANLIASRTFLASSLIALIVVVLGLFAGRAWCGWLCPMGTVLDGITLVKKQNQSIKLPEKLRGIKYGFLITILMAAIFGNLTLLILDPLTLLFRSISTALLPALDQIFTVLVQTGYRIPFLAEPVSKLDLLLRPAIFPQSAHYYRDIILTALVFCGVIGLNWVAPRFWCRYLCPLGGLMGLLGKIGLIRREVRPNVCTSCGACGRGCPTGTIDMHNGYASDPGECTLCLNCLKTCPQSAITFEPRIRKPVHMPYDPGRRQVLGLLGATLIGTAVLKRNVLVRNPDPFLLRPPGVLKEEDFLSKCIRCGECVRACPTSVLQLSVQQAGLEGLWTPIMVPRLGYCQYNCNLCGQVCPVQAIPPMPLEEKRVQVIGHAYVDENRCIAWSDGTPCIVCEEMCPLPEKAITLQPHPNPRMDGMQVDVPVVHRDRCIGCGICEYRCPIAGPAAIRVYTDDQKPIF